MSPDNFNWDRTKKSNTTRTIHAYSNAPFIELFVKIASQGIKPVGTMVLGEGSYAAEFEDVEWKAYCSLAAVARMEEDDDVAVSTEVTTCGPPFALRLSIHRPLSHTGTESALFLNGQDAALIRAADATGQMVLHMANRKNVSFPIVSGPGEIQGSVRQSKIIQSQQCSVAHCKSRIGPSSSPRPIPPKCLVGSTIRHIQFFQIPSNRIGHRYSTLSFRPKEVLYNSKKCPDKGLFQLPGIESTLIIRHNAKVHKEREAQ
ncbi:unnamed protein product [Cylindrotheca closterium]|uniref:Beta-galactosidase n=1 Tax=Cylindrotheca closterium TaxID=2856 RepID=A0AAD2JJ94_9STRA|nr:unnamed protein product [Cylindrotheca closterium]